MPNCKQNNVSKMNTHMQKSESTFLGFFDHSDDGMILVDSTGIVREWSKGYEHISGLSKESVIDKMYLWEVAELLFPFEKQTKEEECERIKADLVEVVASMQQKKLVRHVRHTQTGEHRIFNVLYFPVAMPEGIMLGGISRDITEEVRHREQLEENERRLSAEKERLKTLNDNLPEGTLYRFVFNRDTGKRYMEYVSATWEQITGLTPESVAEDIKPFDDIVYHDDWKNMDRSNKLTTKELSDYNIEVRINKKGKIRWLRIASRPFHDGNKMVWDGIMMDVTVRKEAEAELTKYREELEFLVRERTEELETVNEELYASNEELDRYRSKLEWMVEQKTTEIVAQQKGLEILSRRQAILIKVLQIIQSAKNIPQAINAALAQIGKYAGVSRVYIFEKSADETFIKCTYEWLHKSITHSIKNACLPVKVVQPLFETFDVGEIVCTSDIHTLHPETIEILERLEVKSTICFPLSSDGIHYGFVGFDECTANREWEQDEMELLKSFSQIISTNTRRYQVETSMRLSQQSMRTVLDNINAHVFVIDFDTTKILFANKSLKKLAGNDIEGQECWKVLQKGKTDVCDFCPRQHLRDKDNHFTGVYHWEQYNELFGRYYAYDIAAVEWVDGRMVQLEVSFDITDRKLAEVQLIRAKEKAEESDKLKSAFLANMSHEIRTPLNGITGFLHFLAADNLSPERKYEYINVINNSSAQLVKLIDDIVDVAKIEAKQLNILPIPVHLNNLMKEFQIFFETLVQINNKQHIMLVLDDSEFIDNCVAFIDPMRLRQVFNNLIDNAIKFTEKGYIRFGYRQSAQDKLEFVVEDTGIGIADDLHEVIFDRFRRIESTNNRLYRGTGIGLNIAQNLVQLMGGDIRVKSAEGVGSSFYFTISYLPVMTKE